MPDLDADPDDKLIADLGGEYTPLEALLKCLLDAQKPGHPPSDERRLAKAVEALTDHKVQFDELPDSPISKALYEMARIQHATYLTHLKPEFGGSEEPERDWESTRELARQACADLGLDFALNEEKLRKQYDGTYFEADSADQRLRMSLLPKRRIERFKPEVERTMLEDFQTIQRLLAKHGVPMKLTNVFWRTVGRN
jgi:hypothetical protein